MIRGGHRSMRLSSMRAWAADASGPSFMWQSLPTLWWAGNTQRFSSAGTKVGLPIELGRLNHIAIAASDLPAQMCLYRDVLGCKVSDPQPLPDHGVTVVFVQVENTKIELLEPLGKKSPIAAFLAKNPRGGLHHVCYEVENIFAAMAELERHDIKTLSDEPKIGAHGKPVVFIHPKDCGGVLVELEQV